MAQGQRKKNDDQRFACVARALIEGGVADPSAGRYSRTVFMASSSVHREPEAIVIDAALAEGHGVVSLWFRPGATSPRHVTVALMHAGARIEVRSCVMWIGEQDGPIVLVPFDGCDDFHFSVGPEGLERRDGRPAGALGAGMARARKRFQRGVRDERRAEAAPDLGDVGGRRAA